MKSAILFLLCTAPVLAQTSLIPAACGNIDTDYKVKVEKSEHALMPPEAGKARVYFFHDAGTDTRFAYPVVKVAMDGNSVGANHGNSYFSVSINPGEHHVCTTLQSSFVESRYELAHFTAEAGKTYYYRTRIFYTGDYKLMLDLMPVDSEQGEYRVKVTPLSVSTLDHDKSRPTKRLGQ